MSDDPGETLKMRAREATQKFVRQYEEDVAAGRMPPLSTLQLMLLHNYLCGAWTKGGEDALVEMVQRMGGQRAARPTP